MLDTGRILPRFVSSLTLGWLLFVWPPLQAQEVVDLPVQPQWSSSMEWTNEQGETLLLVDFAGAGRWKEDEAFPVYRIHYPLPGPGQLTASLEDPVWVDWPLAPGVDVARLPESFDLRYWVSADRDRHVASGYLMPLRRQGSSWQRLERATIRLRFTPQTQTAGILRGDETENSVLAEGTAYKLAVPAEGVYRLSYDYLKNTLKIPVDQIDPRRIHIYGNGGAMLPRRNSDPRADDLVENAIFIQGEEDGVFHSGDYILFYAPGPHPIRLDGPGERLTRETHLYDTRSYYFLKVEWTDGLRVRPQPGLSEENSVQVRYYDEVQRLEEELVNLLDFYNSAQGSGNRWFGDRFSAAVKSVDYASRFQLQNLEPNAPVSVRGAFASRSDAGNRFTLNVGKSTFQSGIMNSTNLGNVEATFAHINTLSGTFTPDGAPFPMLLTYTAVGTNATGWLDFLELNCRKRLRLGNAPLRFTDLQSRGQEKATFLLEQADGNTRIWDITNPLQPAAQNLELVAGEARFTRPAETLATYLAFSPAMTLPAPEFIGVVTPQNLHGILEAEMLIVYHPDFEAAAERLADHRRQHSGLQVVTAPVHAIYNEFASGSKDPFAIRDFARMLYQRDSRFRYLLLFGDASFDTRNNRGLQQSGDFVPVFETDESMNPIFAYPTDDFFGLLDPEEGAQPTGQAIDVAIGRLPVETLAEANQVVDKIIRYDLAPETYGDWRLRAVFMADDEDNNHHINDADGLAESLQSWVPELNVDKIYLDAYKQLATPGGQRYPDANKAFNNSMFKGALLVNYLGHGGPSGWTQERVLQLEDIQSWSNTHRLPLFLTATCTFTAFDNPDFKSGGESVLLNPRGGGIALFSTVRPVYATQNKELALRALQELFADTKPWEQPIGEILRRAKNKRGNGPNDRKFLLIGDPAQFLAYPRSTVVTTRINGRDVPASPQAPVDTLRALQTVTIEGEIRGQDGQLMTDFNGVVYPTVYDKAVTVKTLGNDPKSQVRDFRLQKNTLFKGAATVDAGRFSFTFTVPQDIIFQPGAGKISYYAWDENSRDAGGSFADFHIDGVDADPVVDDLPPLVEVFMDGPDWVSGGLTSERPILHVELYDDTGFNISGTSVGQDALAILNEDNRSTFILNEFFLPVRDDSRRGIIRYPLDRLEPGRYTIRVRAWDIFNNPGEGVTEFVVGRLDDGAMAHLLNYPNPVTDLTRFRFEHNLAGQTLRISLDIFDMQGRLVKNIAREGFVDSNRVSDLEWDGLDGNGRPLPAGIYLYKVTLQALDGQRRGQGAESKVEKLVLLK